MALPFLPQQHIRLVYNNLQVVADVRLAPLFNYFSHQWINGIDIDMWCVGNDIRTTNNLEGWHNRFAKLVGTHHPNLWKLLTKIREEQASTDVTIQQIIAGHIVTRRKAVYSACNRRINRLRRQFTRNRINPIHFLNGIGYNLKMNV
jgi:hypothetical protein